MSAKNVALSIVYVLGAAKLVLEANGLSVLDEGLINDIANGVAAVVTAVGIYRNNRKSKSE